MSERRAILSTVPLKILFQITMLHVLRHDTWHWVTAMMISDHHAEQTYHVRVIQTPKCCHFSLEVKPSETTTSLGTCHKADCHNNDDDDNNTTVSWSFPCVNSSFVVFEQGICNHKLLLIAKFNQLFPSLVSLTKSIFTNAFLISVFSNNCIPVSHNHQVFSALYTFDYLTLFLRHNIDFLIAVCRGRHVCLYYHNVHSITFQQ